MTTISFLVLFALVSSVSASDFFKDISELEDILRREFRVFPGAGRSACEISHDEAYQLVLSRLTDSAVPGSFVQAAFSDSRTKILQEVLDRFKNPAEKLPYEEYRKIFITPVKIKAGVQFYESHKNLLETVSRRLGVDPLILVSLAGVETYYGRNSGNIAVFNALYTITRAIPSRSNWAGRELAEYLKLCYGEQWEAHFILGSYAGAFGYGQFMPSSFNAYTIDFDGDGRRRYDDWPDVLGSIANYLKVHGYLPGDPFTQESTIGRSLYSYNPSENYVRVILEFRESIMGELPSA